MMIMTMLLKLFFRTRWRVELGLSFVTVLRWHSKTLCNCCCCCLVVVCCCPSKWSTNAAGLRLNQHQYWHYVASICSCLSITSTSFTSVSLYFFSFCIEMFCFNFCVCAFFCLFLLFLLAGSPGLYLL